MAAFPSRLHGLAAIPLVLLLCTSTAHALDPSRTVAEYSVTSWSQAEGLLTGVTALAQDAAGYLWVGGESGLFRFDGSRFVRQDLGSPRVTGLCAAVDGSVWVGLTEGNVVRLLNGRQTRHPVQETLPRATVIQLLCDRSGKVWAATSQGLLHLIEGRWEPLDQEKGPPRVRIQSLYEDPRGTLWIGAEAGVFERLPDGRFVERAGPSQVRGFSADASGSVWTTHHQRLFTRIAGTQAPAESPTTRGLGMDLLRDRDGSLWVATRGQGLARIRGGEVERLRRQDGLTSDSVQRLLEDREGNLWVGTVRGLDVISVGSVSKAPARGRADTEIVYSVTSDGHDGVWAGTIDGLDRFSQGVWTRYGERHGLGEAMVYDTHVDSSGRLWLSTNHGVGSFVDGRFRPLPDPSGTALTRVDGIATDREGGVWVCDLGSGLHRWANSTWRTFEDQLETKGCGIIQSDSRGRVWIAQTGGRLAIYEDGQFQRFTTADGFGAPVNVIHEDAHGVMWLGTRNGIGRYADGRFAFARINEFSESNVTALTDDAQGRLWLGVGPLLVQVEIEEVTRKIADPAHRMRYRLFDKTDGLPGIPVKVCCSNSTRTADGRLWFLTTGGVAVVDPRRLEAPRAAPKVVIESVLADGELRTPAEGLTLAPLTSSIQIDYTAMTLASAASTRFRYRLEGFDTNWIDAGERRQASYTNLPPGHYSFVVAATALGSEPGDARATWAFSIAPTFYQTRWFPAVCAALGALILSAAWQLRLRQVHKRVSLVVAERTRMARELHDTLLQGLVGVALQFDGIAQQMDTSPSIAQNRLRRVRRQVEQFIRETRKAIFELRSETLERSDLPTALREAGHLLTDGRELSFTLVVEGTPRPLGSNLEQQILRVSSEAVANAVQHGNPTDITATLSYRDTSVCLRVSDNGAGFDVEHVQHQLHRGLGLSSMRERARQARGVLSLVSSPSRGTQVELVVPSTGVHED